jgi:hypothetical protein
MGEVAREALRAGWSGTLFSALRAIQEFCFCYQECRPIPKTGSATQKE